MRRKRPGLSERSEVSSFTRKLKVITTLSFHVVVLLRTAKKCTKIYNAQSQQLFWSLTLLIGEVLVVSFASRTTNQAKEGLHVLVV